MASHSLDPVLGASPPGTVQLELIRSDLSDAAVALHPTPTSNPNDPLNWKPWEKYLNFTLVLYYSILVFAILGVATPTWAPMNQELGFSYETLLNSYAVGSATLCIGALLFIPLALTIGRRPIYAISTLLQFAFSIWFAKMSTTADLYLTTGLSCLVGALAEVIVQMTIADLFFVHQRGLMNSIYVWAMVIGISLGPLASGYVTNGQGWRWVWWWMAILFGVCFVLFIFLYEETMFHESITGVAPEDSQEGGSKQEAPKTDDEKEMDKVKQDTTALSQVHTVDIDSSIPRNTYIHRLALWSSSPSTFHQLARYIYQPLLVLSTIPAALWVALFYGMLTATWQVMTTIISSVMPEPPYNFDASQIGLLSLAPFAGTTVGSIIFGPVSDRLILWLAKRNGGIYEPEMRLWPLLGFAPVFPAGILLFGYSLGNGWHWGLVAAGFALLGVGMGPASSVVLTYLVDAYTDIVADAFVGVTFIRNGIATAFVFAVTPWTEKVGLANMFLTLGMIITAVVVFGGLGFLYFGKRMRAMTARRYRVYAMMQARTRD